MPYEIIYCDDYNRRTSLFHVASQQRMDELFTVEGWSGVTFVAIVPCHILYFMHPEAQKI